MVEITTLFSSTMVVLRESFEAFLIVGIMAGLVTRLGAPERRKTIYMGTLAGVAASVVVGWAMLRLAGGLRERYEVGFEAFASLLAAAVLTYMIIWMYRHTQDLFGTMQSQLREALKVGAVGALFMVPFLAVLREGFETVLFLSTDREATGAVLVAALFLGIAGAAALGALLFSGVLRLNVRAFFAVTGGLLVFFAAGMVRYGVHELGEIMETRPALHEAGEILAGPLSWACGIVYLLALGLWYMRPLWKAGPVAPAAAE